MQYARAAALTAFPEPAHAWRSFGGGRLGIGPFGQFRTDGGQHRDRPVNLVRSGTGNTYDKANGLSAYHDQLILTDKVGTPPTLTVNAVSGPLACEGRSGRHNRARAHAAGGHRHCETRALHAPPNSGVVLPPYLRISVSALKKLRTISTSGRPHDGVEYRGDQQADDHGALGRPARLDLHRHADREQGPLQGNGITITLNQKIVTALISCTPKCAFTPYSINASAIDVN